MDIAGCLNPCRQNEVNRIQVGILTELCLELKDVQIGMSEGIDKMEHPDNNDFLSTLKIYSQFFENINVVHCIGGLSWSG